MMLKIERRECGRRTEGETKLVGTEGGEWDEWKRRRESGRKVEWYLMFLS